MTRIAELIKEKKKEFGWNSDRKAATAIGIRDTTLGRCLDNETKEITVTTLAQMALAFNCSIYEVIELHLQDLADWYKKTDVNLYEQLSQLLERQRKEQEEFYKKYFRAVSDMEKYLVYETDYLYDSCDAVNSAIDELRRNISKHLNITIEHFPEFESPKNLAETYPYISDKIQHELRDLERRKVWEKRKRQEAIKDHAETRLSVSLLGWAEEK